ncbi:NAD-dependent epimerase/dehydratase family protein [Dyadobacter soli]|nr:NAD-dependent epimerase/dehydratase family protein [Dyadobacter soli]
MQTILGSGSAIGNLLAKELKNFTNHIRLVARKPVKVNADDELFPADLLDKEKVEMAVKGSDVVYLTVGLPYNTRVWEWDWPVIMHNVVSACLKSNARLVFLDNVYMYSADEIPRMTETSPLQPPSRKGRVRTQIQQIMLDAIADRGLQGLIARSADFYGPSVANSPLAITVLDEFRKGKKAFWQVDDSKLHAFTYVPDAARALAMLGNTEDCYGEIWHLPTSSEKLTGKEFITKVAAELKCKPDYYVFKRWMMKLVGIFVPIVRELGEMSYQYDRDYAFDSSKFENRFSYNPVSYAEGIREMVQASV